MDNNRKLSEGLLKADGIEPSGLSEGERAVFREMLDREEKRMKHLSWFSVGAMWIFALGMFGLCVSEKILEALHIPFVVAWFGLIVMIWAVIIRYYPRYYRKLKESNKKIRKLHFLVYAKHRGFALVGKKNGKRIIHWPSLLILTTVIWLFVSLSGAGVCYLLCQRWIFFSSPILHIFFCSVISLPFVIFLLLEGFRAPLDELVEVKAKSKKSKPGSRLDICRIIMKSRITKFAAAAVVILAILIAINQFGRPINMTSVAWASIAEQFKSVPFFKATIYMKEDALDRPVQVEVWRNRQGLARLRYGSQVVFARDGKVIQAFDLKSRSETEPSGMLVDILAKFATDEFSLETVVQAISGVQLVNVTPLVNAQASISKDIVVFDVEHEGSPQWFRIWALRESKLPTYIRMWDPRDGECADVILTYSKEQEDRFFDPNAFSKEMKKTGNKEINLAYMFLEDPGGKQVVPRTLDEHQVFKVVTQTIDGNSWSLADHRGKVILLNFRTGEGRRQWESFLKETYNRFGNREDFVMVDISLCKDAESAKAIINKLNIEWPVLHEPGKGLNNGLATAFAIDKTNFDVENIIYNGGKLIWKNGWIDTLNSGGSSDAEKLEGAILGLTYKSHIWIDQVLQRRQKHQTLTTKDVKELCGDDYTVDDLPIAPGLPTVPGRKRWAYKVYNEDKSRMYKLLLAVEDETVVGWSSSNSLVDPAIVTVSFSGDFIRDHIESQVETDVFEKMYKDYKVMVSSVVSGRKDSLGFAFANNSIKSDESYQRQLPAGTYDFVINIGPTNKYGSITKIIKQIVLRKDVQLNKNESKTIRFE